MTRAIIGILLATLAWSSVGSAQDHIVIVRQFAAVPGLTLSYDILCPDNYLPGRYELTYVESQDGLRKPVLVIEGIDRNSVSLPGLSNFVDNVGGGFLATFIGDQADLVGGVLKLHCVRGPGVTAIFNQVPVPPNGVASLTGFCPAPLVPVGQVSNADERALGTQSVVYVYGTPPSVTPMDDLPDGTTGPPSGISRSVQNMTAAPLTLDMATLCAPVPGAQTIIYSAPTLPGERFSIFAPVPDGFDYVGASFAGGLFGSIDNVDLWSKSGDLSTQLAFFDEAHRTFTVVGTFVDGIDARPKLAVAQKASARAVIGIVMAPSPAAPPPPTTVTVVEFYHAALDHYFITPIAKEISDLDTGVHPGWQRTGATFKAYGVGSTGRTGRRPVCRAYGNPAAGLDSHFYSASPAECLATLANFSDEWLLEASEVFQADLPDAATGACPAGGVPIYRVWNGRDDSNHRYLTTLAARDAMLDMDYVAEGYGPDSVTLCALQ